MAFRIRGIVFLLLFLSIFLFLFSALPFALFLLGQDVDIPAGQLRGQAHVLATPANRDVLLLVGNDDLDLGAGGLESPDLGPLRGQDARGT